MAFVNSLQKEIPRALHLLYQDDITIYYSINFIDIKYHGGFYKFFVSFHYIDVYSDVHQPLYLFSHRFEEVNQASLHTFRFDELPTLCISLPSLETEFLTFIKRGIFAPNKMMNYRVYRVEWLDVV